MNLKVKKVETKEELKQFVRFPWKIYQNDPYWVPPLLSEQMKFLDKKSGPFFEFGEAEYFIAYDGAEPVGTISAQANHQYEKFHDKETGFFGFFECIDNQEVADALFAEAKSWLQSKNKSKILGPMSFTIYDISGMLYEGFDSSPVILLAYNPAYYNDLVTRAGLTKEIDWYAFNVSKDSYKNPALFRVRDRVLRQKDLRIESVDMKRLDEYVKLIGLIFNDAWMENWGHVPLTENQLKHLTVELKPVVVPELTYFAFLNGECVGFSLSIKDANPALKKANGRLLPFGLIKILLAMRKITRLRTIVMGVLKEHRHRGIDVAFYANTVEQGIRLGYSESECSIIVETNQRMIRALEELSAERYKTYRFYEAKIG
jgi:hypothetical protein